MPRTYKGDPVAEDFRFTGERPAIDNGGKAARDYGADIALVGPGAAYERFKQTPAYQQRRKKTEQIFK